MQDENLENLVEMAASEEELSQLIEELEDGDCEELVSCETCTCVDSMDEPTEEERANYPKAAPGMPSDSANPEMFHEDKKEAPKDSDLDLSNVQTPWLGKMKMMRSVGDWFYTNLYRAIDDMDEDTLDNTYHNWYTWVSTMDSVSYLKDNFLRFQTSDETKDTTQKEQLAGCKKREDCGDMEDDEEDMQTSPSDPEAYKRDSDISENNNEADYSKNNSVETNLNRNEEEIEIDMTHDELKELMRSVVAEATSNLSKENAELNAKLNDLQNKEAERKQQEELSEIEKLRKEIAELRKAPASLPANTVGNYQDLKAGIVRQENGNNGVDVKKLGSEIDSLVSEGRADEAIKAMMRNGVFGQAVKRFYK